MRNAFSSGLVSVGSSRNVEYLFHTGVASGIIFVADCLFCTACHDSIYCHGFGCCLVLIFGRSLFAVSWLFEYVMPHLQKMLHVMMCPSTHVRFDWPQLYFLQLVFSPPFFVLLEWQRLRLGVLVRIAMQAIILLHWLPGALQPPHLRPLVLSLQLGGWRELLCCRTLRLIISALRPSFCSMRWLVCSVSWLIFSRARLSCSCMYSKRLTLWHPFACIICWCDWCHLRLAKFLLADRAMVHIFLTSELDGLLSKVDWLLSEENGLLSISGLGPSLLLRTQVMMSVVVGSCFGVVLVMVNYTAWELWVFNHNHTGDANYCWDGHWWWYNKWMKYRNIYIITKMPIWVHLRFIYMV